MKVKIIKDWAHALAPNHIFKKGDTVNLPASDIHVGISLGFIQDPNKPEVEVKKKTERATSKKISEKR